VAEELPQRLAPAPVPLGLVVLLHLWVQPLRLGPQLPVQQGQSLEQKPVQPQNSNSDLAPLPEQGLSSCSRSKERSLTRLSLQQKPKLFCA
jgi:hypothetical protein